MTQQYIGSRWTVQPITQCSVCHGKGCDECEGRGTVTLFSEMKRRARLDKSDEPDEPTNPGSRPEQGA